MADWMPAEQERLAEHYFRALHSLTEHLEEAGETEAALGPRGTHALLSLWCRRPLQAL
jgi:hypothetical protein